MVLDHAYGLRTLVLSLEISVSESLDPPILDNLAATVRESIHELLAHILGMREIQALINQAYLSEPYGEIQSLGWYRHSIHGSSRACLSASGRLSFNDVVFLMKRLSESQGAMQRVFRASSVIEFGTMLFLFWQHTLKITL